MEGHRVIIFVTPKGGAVKRIAVTTLWEACITYDCYNRIGVALHVQNNLELSNSQGLLMEMFGRRRVTRALVAAV